MQLFWGSIEQRGIDTTVLIHLSVMQTDWSKILFTIFTIIVLLSIAATAYRYLIVRDYQVIDDTGEYSELEE